MMALIKAQVDNYADYVNVVKADFFVYSNIKIIMTDA